MVGGPGGGGDTMAVGGKMHGGQQWDYVFDVDAEEGAAPRKLPANRGEDPYVVADRFLMEEGLPISYRRVLGLLSRPSPVLDHLCSSSAWSHFHS